MREACRLDVEEARLMEGAIRGLGLSARGYPRLPKVARTIADLARTAAIQAGHVAEAHQLRNLDHRFA